MGGGRFGWATIALCSAVLCACGSSAGSGGGSGPVATGGVPGSACNPTYQDQGCRAFGAAWTRVQCGVTGVWEALDTCAPGQSCIETAQASPGKHTATCISPGVGSDSGGGQDAGTSGSDGGTGGDGTSGDLGSSGGDGSGQDLTIVGDSSGEEVIGDDAPIADGGKDAGPETSGDTSKDTGKDTVGKDTGGKDTVGKDTVGTDATGTGTCPAGDQEFNDSQNGIHYFFTDAGGQHQLQGPYFRTDQGVVLVEACFDQGQRFGTWTYRYASGALSGTESFDENHLLSGSFVSYFESGQKEYEGTAVAGKLEGSYTEWYENGTVGTQSTYQDGHIVGETHSWYDDGSDQFQGTYDDTGMPTGVFTWWAQDGTVLGKATFVNGSAKLTLTTSKGQVLVTGNYVQGKRDGTWTHFYASGNKARLSQLKLGSGSVIEYADVAGLKKSATYTLVDERRNGTYTQYAADGVTVTLTGTFVDSQQVGTWTATNAGTDTSACWIQGVVVHYDACTDQDAVP